MFLNNKGSEQTSSKEPEINLPSNNWQTKIIEKKVVEGDDKFPNVQVHFFVNISTRKDFSNWLSEFENLTGSSYVIQSTDIEDGQKIALKQRLVCHHSTRCKKIYSSSLKNKTRNTNCPSKLYVKIHTVRKNYRGKQENYELIKNNMPCEITLIATHNHSIGTADSLKFRKVSSEVKKEVINLYENGHTPGTALEMIRCNIQMNNDDYITALADRNQCPSYKYCYDLFIKEFKAKYGPIEFNSKSIVFLQNKLELYNKNEGDMCAKMEFIGQAGSDYVIGICTPIMKRVHKHIENASQIVFMDSSGTVDRDGSKIFVLLTDSECGALPLGLMITTIESVEAIKCGFNIIKELVGANIFGGHEEGPNVFMTDDSLAEQKAVENMWPAAKRLLCVFHVLQAVYRWLSKAKNGIPKEKQITIYNDFRKILYAVNLNDMVEKYKLAMESGKQYANYIDYLNNYWWPKRKSWVKAYRNSLKIYNNYAENTIRQIKDKIFSRVKAFNVVQMTDFMITKFEQYNERKLLDVSSNRMRENPLYRHIKMPSMEIVQRISKLDENIFAVPSETTKDLIYIVNTEVLVCSCLAGITGCICKHLDWANMLYCSINYLNKIDNKIRQKLYFVATGQMPKDDCLMPLIPTSIPTTESAATEQTTGTSLSSSVLVEKREDSKNSQNTIEDPITFNHSEIQKQYEDGIEKILQIFHGNFKKSPLEVASSVEKMLNTLEKIKTPAAFSSAVATFGIGHGQKRKGPLRPKRIKPATDGELY